MATRRTGSTGRFYEIDGRDLPSVTTILGVIAKPALVKWAERTATEEVVNAAADLYEDMSRAAGGASPLSRPGYVATLNTRLGKQRKSAREMAKAQEIGTQAHALVEWRLREMMGQPGKRPAATPPAEWAFQAWDAWRESVHLKPLWVEQVCYSLAHGYAGTLDLLAEVNGRRMLIDWKTSKAIYAEYHMQNAAYQVAVEEMGHGPVEGGLLVRLPKTEVDPAFEVVEVGARAPLFETFRACIDVWSWWYAAEEASRAAWMAKKNITPKNDTVVEQMPDAAPLF